MRKLLLTILAACFYYSGLVPLVVWWKRRAGRHLLILNYHRALGGDLRRHLLYLRRHYRVLPLQEAVEELYAPPHERKHHDRRTPLVITFDDGHHDNYISGFALARELQVPVTLFLP